MIKRSKPPIELPNGWDTDYVNKMYNVITKYLDESNVPKKSDKANVLRIVMNETRGNVNPLMAMDIINAWRSKIED
jgi:hypothetical protein